MSGQARANQAPPEGYHWAYTERREKRHRRLEIVYVHRRRNGQVEAYPFDRSLPLTDDEIYAWGPAVPPGPTTGEVANFERFAPVRRPKGDHDSPRTIPHSVHLRAHKSWAKTLETPMTADAIARRGGFTTAELDRHAPGWRDQKIPTIPELAKGPAAFAELRRAALQAERDLARREAEYLRTCARAGRTAAVGTYRFPWEHEGESANA